MQRFEPRAYSEITDPSKEFLSVTLIGSTQGGAGINIMDLGLVGRVSRYATKYFLTCIKYLVKYTLLSSFWW